MTTGVERAQVYDARNVSPCETFFCPGLQRVVV